MRTYSKIESLWNRDKKTFKVIPGDFRKEEFSLVKRWLLTEKIHGSNIRIILNPDGTVEVRGRTDRAQFKPFWIDTWLKMFPAETMQATFKEDAPGVWPTVILFGEGYGPGINKGGCYRDSPVSFRLFDVLVGDWWLQWSNIADVAVALEIMTVPTLGQLYDSSLPTCRAELEDLIGQSAVAFQDKGAKGVRAEGVVARTNPILCDRRGRRIFWKLKFKDF